MAGAPSLVHPSLSYTLRAQGYHTPYTEVDPGVENAINKLKGLTGQKPLLRPSSSSYFPFHGPGLLPVHPILRTETLITQVPDQKAANCLGSTPCISSVHPLSAS